MHFWMIFPKWIQIRCKRLNCEFKPISKIFRPIDRSFRPNRPKLMSDAKLFLKKNLVQKLSPFRKVITFELKFGDLQKISNRGGYSYLIKSQFSLFLPRGSTEVPACFYCCYFDATVMIYYLYVFIYINIYFCTAIVL